jgi:hypothetical protein
MRLFGIIIALLVAFGSLVPQAAMAQGHSGASAHRMGQSHSGPTKECTDCAGTCIGCAAPVHTAVLTDAPPVPTGPARLRFQPVVLTAFVTPLELPPPRLKA